jgi:flagellar motor switch protein FliG
LAEQGTEIQETRHQPATSLSGVRKAAVVLVAVGEELAKEILRALPEADVQRLTEELADLRGITPELSSEVLEEFWELLETQNFMVHGGLDYASRLLVGTFGKERADDLLMLVRRSQEEAHGNLAKLQRTDPQQLGKLLDSEHPQTIALVLAHLDPKRASMVLENLSESHKDGLHPEAGRDAAVFAGDGAEGRAHSAPAPGKRGRHSAQELFRVQGGGRSAQPAQRRRIEKDS